MDMLPPSPDRPAVFGAPTTGTPELGALRPAASAVTSADARGEPGPRTAVREVVRHLHREHARRVGPGWPPRRARTAAGESPLASWLAGRADEGTGADRATPDPLIGLLATLRALTTRLVCRLRADGVRPEQMLVQVKACVREAVTAEGWQDPEAVEALTAAVVGWSIAAYYDR